MVVSVSKAPVGALASIRVFGKQLDFQAISDALGIDRFESHRVGERGLGGRVYGEDMWSVDSPYPRTHPLDVHLRWLNKALLPHHGYVRTLKRTYEVSSYCGISVDGDHCQFQVSSKALALFVDLGLDMDISLVFAGYSESRLQYSRDPLKGSSASFLARGSGLNLSAISTALGVKSSVAQHLTRAEGEERALSIATLLTSGLPRTAALDSHMKWLGGRLLPHSEFLVSLKKRAELLVRCEIGTASDIAGCSLSPRALKICTGLDVPLDFSAFLIADGHSSAPLGEPSSTGSDHLTS